jgi:hypothetical protein
MSEQLHLGSPETAAPAVLAANRAAMAELLQEREAIIRRITREPLASPK